MTDVGTNDSATIKRLDIPLLQSLIAISRAPTLSSAAASLGIPQPTMSLQMKRLEDRLGFGLFEHGRRGKPMRLSQHGQRLVNHAVRILEAHDDALESLDRINVTGTLTLGISYVLSEICLARMIDRFRFIHPGVALKVIEAAPDDLTRLCKTGDIDSYLCIEHVSQLDNQALWEEPFYWVCDKEQKALSNTPLKIGQLNGSSTFQYYIDSQLKPSPESVGERIYRDSMLTLYREAVKGDLVAPVPESLITPDAFVVLNDLRLQPLMPMQVSIFHLHEMDEQKKQTMRLLKDFFSDKSCAFRKSF